MQSDLDPNLQTASVEGWNPLWRMGTAAGMILRALGFQITEAEDLIRHPEAWESRMVRARELSPEVEPAAKFFEEYMEWKEETRVRRSDSFLNKSAVFSYDPSMKSMFGARNPAIDWKRIINGRMVVLLDLRGEQDIERRRFKMVWAFEYLLSFIKKRGAGRHLPISVIIDELTSLFSVETLAGDILASDLDELINVIARNYAVWLTIAHQELFQIGEKAQKTLMGMGTQVMGVTSDHEASLSLGNQFFRYDPGLVKKREPMYMSDAGGPYIVDYRTFEFTPEEQTILKSYELTQQPRYHFLVRTAASEGDITGPLRGMTLSRIDQGIYVNENLVKRARSILTEMRGVRREEILKEIDCRLNEKEQISLSGGTALGTMGNGNGNSQNTGSDELVFGEKKTSRRSQAGRH